MSAGSPTSDIAAEVSERPDVPLSDIGECLKEENFYSLKEGQAKILGFLLLPRAVGTPRSGPLFGGAMGTSG